jgi:hypothetical protein
MARRRSRDSFRNKSRKKGLRPLASLLAGLSCAGLAAGQSKYYPTYFTGPHPNGSWVVSDGQIITPAGKQIDYSC